MPHKHTRKRNPNATNDYNLAPSTIAKPLAAFSGAAKDGKGKGKFQTKKPSQGGQSKSERTPNLKRKRTSTATTDYKEDDTPRAFARLMQFQTTGKRPSGLDDERASRKAKKRKTAPDTTPSAAKTARPFTRLRPCMHTRERQSDVWTAPACARYCDRCLPSVRLASYLSLYRLFNFARADTSNLLSANHLREGLSSHHDVAMQGSPSRPSCMKREIRHADSAAHATPPVGEAPSRQGQAETAFVRS
ncbi:hypothetical protein LTR12_002528 [Friedmanniomyces endolithicus]|nr:hypothetical protein LTR12_002528 [Friedmanniomyces endolithicus]